LYQGHPEATALRLRDQLLNNNTAIYNNIIIAKQNNFRKTAEVTIIQ